MSKSLIPIDIFNGDADGICSLHQFRLADPAESILVTGVKRDIGLLTQVKAQADTQLYVFDISLDSNRSELERLLSEGAKIWYFDHHFAGEIPIHPGLSAHIDESRDLCTALILDQYLQGKFRAWAVVGAYGDGLDASAVAAASSLHLRDQELKLLRELGVCLNYNSYGETVSDLSVAPADLYRRIRPYKDPLEFIHNETLFSSLRENYAGDIERALEVNPLMESSRIAIYILPAEAWARRVSGAFANLLMQSRPDRALAMLIRRQDEGFLVSVRAPGAAMMGADELCRQFPSGGGRKMAAGINQLSEAMYDEFITKFKGQYA